MSVYTTLFEPHNFIILVVDDCRHNLRLIQNILERVDYQTIIATSANQALSRIKSITPSLIILDLMMPDVDGLEFCSYVKNQTRYQEVPIIFLALSHQESDIVSAFEKGAADYITKPYKHTEVLARIKTHLQLKQARDDLKVLLDKKEVLITKLEQLVTIDSLTEVYNRRHIFFLGEGEFKKSERYHKSFSLLILDIDFFKNINDDYGHPMGDKVLKIVAETIKNLIRDVDYFGRIGGEEFMIILPETDFPYSHYVAQRVRNKISNLAIDIPDSDANIHLTISLGLAVYNSKYDNFEQIVQQADMALYQAKKNGRNQVCYLFSHHS